MTSSKTLSIVSTGIISSIGGNTKMTLAAVKAGVSRSQDSPFFGKNSTPIKMSLIPDEALPSLNEELLKRPLSYSIRRMLRMAGAALIETLPDDLDCPPVALFLAARESLPNCTTNVSGEFIEHLIAQTGANIDKAASRVISYGRAAGLYTIDLAFRYLETTDNKYVLVGGVDTFLDLKLLGYLDQEDRVMTEGVMDGFIPGEGASFLLLTSGTGGVERENSKPAPRVYAPGFSEEKGHRYSDEPYLGEGLSNAFSSALKDKQLIVQSVYSSLNGENIGSKELGVALTRNSKSIEDGYNIEHPADCLGDMGAATGSVLITLAAYYGKKTNLICCSSEKSQRAALCVTR